jgi:hypothetical protein
MPASLRQLVITSTSCPRRQHKSNIHISHLPNMFGSGPMSGRCLRCDGTGTISPRCHTCRGSLGSSNCPTCFGRLFVPERCRVCHGTGRDPALEANHGYGRHPLSLGGAFSSERRALPRTSFLASLFEARIQRGDGDGGRRAAQPTRSYQRRRGGEVAAGGYFDPAYRPGSGETVRYKCSVCEDSGKTLTECSKCGGEGVIGRKTCSACRGIGQEQIDCEWCKKSR